MEQQVGAQMRRPSQPEVNHGEGQRAFQQIDRNPLLNENHSQEISNENMFVFPGHGDVSKLVQNVLIFEEITSYLSWSDLKQIRLVSRLWNQESLSIFRKRAGTINPIPDKYFRIPRKYVENGETKLENSAQPALLQQGIKRAETLLEIIKNSSPGSSFTKFALSTELHEEDRELFYKFLKTVSSFATKLEFIMEHPNVYFNMDTLQFPMLRYLRFRHGGYNFAEKKGMLSCFQHMLHNAPLVDEISLEILDSLEHLIRDFLRAIYSSPIRTQLRALSFQAKVQDKHLLMLKNVGLCLRKLSIEFKVYSKIRPRSVIALLESQSGNLEELTLKYELRQEFPVKFPCMRKLSVLNLQADRMEFPNLSFSRDLPALKRLEFGHLFEFFKCYLTTTTIFGDVMEPSNTVETLVIHEALDDSKIMDQIARIFPKLKRLECQAPGRSGVKQMMGNGLINLEELSLDLYLDVLNREAQKNAFNEYMTGYSNYELKRMEKKWRAGRELSVEGNKMPAELFQKLKFLQINYGHFTDVLCLLGPMRFRSLKCLSLTKSTDLEISQRVLQQMREKFNVLIEYKFVIPNSKATKFITDVLTLALISSFLTLLLCI